MHVRSVFTVQNTNKQTNLVNFLQGSIETAFSVHILAVLSLTVLGHCTSRRALTVLCNMLALYKCERDQSTVEEA